MSSISAAAVQELRRRTDLPMMKCKEALTRSGGDMDKAIELLRTEEKNLMVKMGGRETTEGRIAIVIDAGKKAAAILELRCETAPVGKSDQFVKLASELTQIIIDKDPKTPEELATATNAAGKSGETLMGEVIAVLRENMKVQRFVRLEGGQFGMYVHHDGSVGTLTQAVGDKPDPVLLKDVCMHVTAYKPTPVAVTKEQVDPTLIAKEMEIATAKAIATGKPSNIAEMIAKGQMSAWFKDHVLIEQPFVKDPTKTVGQLAQAGGLELTAFVRLQVGEIPG